MFTGDGDAAPKLADAAASRIARLIESGTYPPGSQLPPERELAEQFAVSRTAIREAFRALEAIGLVEAHVGRGRFVTGDASDRRSHFLASQLFDLHRSDWRDLSVIREVLEVAAIQQIPRAEFPSIGAKMRAVLAKSAQAMVNEQLDEVARLDSEFHAIPVEHCPNRPLRVLTNGVVVAMGGVVREVLKNPTWDRSSLTQHERIVEAFEEGDRELAAVLVGRHQTSAHKRLVEARADELSRDNP